MKRENHDLECELVDLGSVSTETKGAMGGTDDVSGMLKKNGLSDDGHPRARGLAARPTSASRAAPPPGLPRRAYRCRLRACGLQPAIAT